MSSRKGSRRDRRLGRKSMVITEKTEKQLIGFSSADNLRIRELVGLAKAEIRTILGLQQAYNKHVGTARYSDNDLLDPHTFSAGDCAQLHTIVNNVMGNVIQSLRLAEADAAWMKKGTKAVQSWMVGV